MNKNTMLLLLVAAGAFYAMRAKAATKSNAINPATGVSNTSKNVNDQLWSKLLGDGWKMLRDAQANDGAPGFLEKNWLGQITTSDGKPVGQELADLLPSTYMTQQPVDLSDPASGINYLSELGW